MNKQERRQMFARQAREQKARDDAYHAARVAASQARHAANAARVAAQMEEMEKAGLVSPMGRNGQREILVPKRDE